MDGFSPSPKFDDILTCHWISLSRVSNANTTVTSWQIIAIVLDSLSNVNPVNGNAISWYSFVSSIFHKTTYRTPLLRSVAKIKRPSFGRVCNGLCCPGTVASVDSLENRNEQKFWKNLIITFGVFLNLNFIFTRNVPSLSVYLFITGSNCFSEKKKMFKLFAEHVNGCNYNNLDGDG